jgi:hypothetical protein
MPLAPRMISFIHPTIARSPRRRSRVGVQQLRADDDALINTPPSAWIDYVVQPFYTVDRQPADRRDRRGRSLADFESAVCP